MNDAYILKHNPDLIDRKVIDRIKFDIEHEADYQNERVNADIARGMYRALEIIEKWEVSNA